MTDAGLDVPSAWRSAADRILDAGWRTTLIIGETDAGKSTLCRYLCRRILEARAAVAVVDADIGQKDIGPPATVTLGFPDGSRPLAETPPDGFYFVGSTNPIRGMVPLVIGVARLARAAERPFVLVDTPGAVRGPGQTLQGWLIETVRHHPRHRERPRARTHSRRTPPSPHPPPAPVAGSEAEERRLPCAGPRAQLRPLFRGGEGGPVRPGPARPSTGAAAGHRRPGCGLCTEPSLRRGRPRRRVPWSRHPPARRSGPAIAYPAYTGPARSDRGSPVRRSAHRPRRARVAGRRSFEKGLRADGGQSSASFIPTWLATKPRPS